MKVYMLHLGDIEYQHTLETVMSVHASLRGARAEAKRRRAEHSSNGRAKFKRVKGMGDCWANWAHQVRIEAQTVLP